MPETKTAEETLSYIRKQLVRFRYDPDLYIFWRNVYNSLKHCCKNNLNKKAF